MHKKFKHQKVIIFWRSLGHPLCHLQGYLVWVSLRAVSRWQQGKELNKMEIDDKTWFILFLSCGLVSLISIPFYFCFADILVLCVVLTGSTAADGSVPASLPSRPHTQPTVHRALASQTISIPHHNHPTAPMRPTKEYQAPRNDNFNIFRHLCNENGTCSPFHFVSKCSPFFIF